jgi:hypothetical protein
MKPSPPVPPPPPAVRKSQGMEEVLFESKEGEKPSGVSPLKAAADLIQTLDIAYAEMTHYAADAAKDAEEARRNSRTASEIARRYLQRSYPKIPSNFGGAPSPKQATRSEESKEGVLAIEVNPEDSNHQSNGTPRSHVPPSPMRLAPSMAALSPNRNRARIYQSSADRIAQSHAEDVLALSLDLERSKQSFKKEQCMHDETKAALSAQKVKATTLEEENVRLKEQLAQLAKEHAEKVSKLQQDIDKSKYIVKAAEEDAELALNLAQESSQKRDELEQELERVKKELLTLSEKTQASVQTPARAVRFADESSPMDVSIVPTTPQSTPSRSMVAAGRQVLRRSQAGSPSAEVVTLELTPAKSAERRRRLRERLSEQQASPLALTLSTPPQPPPSSREIPTSPFLEDYASAAKLLQESGRRLELSGYWFRKDSLSGFQEMEAMTRQYCQSVEFKVDRQQKEINGLEALCGFLERKLVTGDGESS